MAKGDVGELLRRTRDDVVAPDDVLPALVRRRRRRELQRRISALTVGLAVVALGVGVVLRESRDRSVPVPMSSPVPQPVVVGQPLQPGPYVLQVRRLQVTFDVPAGWQGWELGVNKDAADPPSGAGFGVWVVTNVYEDPCQWNRSLAQPPVGPTVGDLVEALTAQRGHPTSGPIAATIDGHPATRFEQVVPEALHFDTCWGSSYRSWQANADDRYHQGPGQIDRLWILEVRGTRVVIDASYYRGTAASDRTALFDIVRSVRFTAGNG